LLPAGAPYSQIGDLPLVVSVGQSTADIYAQRSQFAFGVSFMLVLLCAVAIGLAMYLASELVHRKDAETKLATLAATDGLTSLSNRRQFNEVIAREWQRAMREKSQLALLMLDADNFKSYNDINGHQAGDALLKTVGAAIASSIGRGGDIGARYGGDEFAILLPNTSADGAERVAKKIRQTFAELCERERIVCSGLSIGIASITPAADERFGELVGLADLALYRAKDLGRNRTEVAMRTPGEPSTALPAQSHKAA
jgi:diguanylate cyclase (GGDEF)-like protein